MNIKDIFKNYSGFSLLEVVIAMGIASFGILVTMQANKMGIKGSKQAEIVLEVESLRMRILDILADPNSCLHTFKQPPPLNALYRVSRNFHIQPGEIKIGSVINGVTIKELNFEQIGSGLRAKKQFELEVVISYKIVDTQRERKLLFPFYAYTSNNNDNKITGCFSSVWNEMGDQNESVVSDFCTGLLGGTFTGGSCLFEIQDNVIEGKNIPGIKNSAGESLLSISEMFNLLEEKIHNTSQYLTENHSLIVKNTNRLEDQIMPQISMNQGLARGQLKRLQRYAEQHNLPITDLKENPTWSEDWFDVNTCKSPHTNPVLQCSSGKIIRTRKCLFQDPQKGALTCPGKGSSIDYCPLPICYVPMPTGSAWQDIRFGVNNDRLCSEDCGGGIKIKYRYCFSAIHEEHGLDYNCRNESGSIFTRGAMEMIQETCNNTLCDTGIREKVDGGWSSWLPQNETSSCEVKYTLGESTCVSGKCHNPGQLCGTGSRGVIREYRTCTNPSPSGGGEICTGNSSRERNCNLSNVAPKCEGKVSSWSNQGSCSQSCGPGQQTQVRTCDKSNLVSALESKAFAESGIRISLDFECSEPLTRQVNCNLGACP